MPVSAILTPDELNQVLAKVATLPKLPVVIEAFWDGDTTGWMVKVVAIVDEPSPRHPAYTAYPLAALRGAGGDMRLFNAQVPPWPEAAAALALGRTLTNQFGVPFYFLSPDWPRDECPRWWEQDKAKPCQRCRILIMEPANSACPWRGICYPCYLEQERAKRAAPSPPASPPPDLPYP